MMVYHGYTPVPRENLPGNPSRSIIHRTMYGQFKHIFPGTSKNPIVGLAVKENPVTFGNSGPQS